MKAWSSAALAFEEPRKSLIHSSTNLLGFLCHIFPPLEVEVSTTPISDAWISSTSLSDILIICWQTQYELRSQALKTIICMH